MHAHQAFFFSRLTVMDRNQVVSLVLLIAIVFGLMLDGVRAFGAIDVDEDEEVQGPMDSAPALSPAPAPSSSQRDWNPTLWYERRFA